MHLQSQKGPPLRVCVSGNIIAEYALLSGLVALLCVGALTGLGENIDNLFKAKPDSENVLVRMSSMDFGGGHGDTSPGSPPSGGPALQGTGYMKLSMGPDGKVIYEMTDGDSGFTTNATSVDGKTQWNTLGSMLVANTLQGMAERYPEGSPAHSWFMQLSKMGYYMGAVEAIRDGKGSSFTALASSDKANHMENYKSNTGAQLADISGYQGNLKSLLDNPPKGVSAKDLNTAVVLASEIHNIGQSCINAEPHHKASSDSLGIAKTLVFADMISAGTSDPYSPALREAGKDYVSHSGTPLEPVTVTLDHAGRLETAAAQP